MNLSDVLTSITCQKLNMTSCHYKSVLIFASWKLNFVSTWGFSISAMLSKHKKFTSFDQVTCHWTVFPYDFRLTLYKPLPRMEWDQEGKRRHGTFSSRTSESVSVALSQPYCRWPRDTVAIPNQHLVECDVHTSSHLERKRSPPPPISRCPGKSFSLLEIEDFKQKGCKDKSAKIERRESWSYQSSVPRISRKSK